MRVGTENKESTEGTFWDLARKMRFSSAKRLRLVQTPSIFLASKKYVGLNLKYTLDQLFNIIK